MSVSPWYLSSLGLYSELLWSQGCDWPEEPTRQVTGNCLHAETFAGGNKRRTWPCHICFLTHSFLLMSQQGAIEPSRPSGAPLQHQEAAFSQKPMVLLAPPSLSLNSSSGEWGSFVLPKDILFFLPTNQLEAHKKLENSLCTFKIGGTPRIRSVTVQVAQLCPGWMNTLPSQTGPQHRAPQGEFWRRVIRWKSYPNSHECFNLVAFEEEIFLPQDSLQLSGYFPPLRSLELPSPVWNTATATLPNCDVLFFAEKKEHLQLCELKDIK